MAERGVIGSELEYGLSFVTPDRPDLGFIPVHSNNLITDMIKKYAAAELTAGAGHIAMVGDKLTNGGRLYDDHHHPEYSTPEVLTIYDLLKYNRAGEKTVADLCEYAKQTGLILDYILTRRVSDHYGNTWGSHTNYQVLREVLSPGLYRTQHAKKFAMLGLLMAVREAVVGSGGLYMDPSTGQRGYAASQKVMGLTQDYDVRTTVMKPVVNLRDMPYSNSELFTRLHDTSGDANLLMRPKFIRVGMTLITLGILEHGIDLQLPENFSLQPGELVRLAKHTATDLTCKKPFEFACGYRVTPVQIGQLFVEAAAELERRGLLSEEQVAARALWRHDLDALARSPNELRWLNEWATRLGLLGGESHMSEGGPEDTRYMHNSADLQRKDGAIDRVLPDSSPKKTVLKKLREKHAVATAREGSDRWFPTEDEIQLARVEAPTNTRAYDRGRIVRHLAHRSCSGTVGWSAAVLGEPPRIVAMSTDPREYNVPEVLELLREG